MMEFNKAIVAAFVVITSHLFFSEACLAGEPVMAGYLPPGERILVKPMLDTALRDPSVCRGPDGTYYLTGTLSFKDEAKDWDNNAGIRVWKSKDLKAWEDLGLVWKPDSSKQWNRTPLGAPDRYDGLRHNNAIVAPEIHYFKETFWLAYSRGGYGTALLKSTTGKAEGPYAPPGPYPVVTNWGKDPSLFQDDDGAVYWLWSGDAPVIAKMKDDMSALAEPPRLLICRSPDNDQNNKPKDMQDDLVGRGGPFLYKVDGKYHLIAADIIPKHSIMAGNVFLAVSTEGVYGPYGQRSSFIPHGGQSTVFNDGSGNWYATYCGRDRFSAFRDQAGVFPLEWLKGYGGSSFRDGPLMTRNKARVVTERGPWHKLRPLFADDPNPVDRIDHIQLWDTGIIQAPDGYFYITGSQYGPKIMKKLRVWRSRDLKTWEAYRIRTHGDEQAFSQERKDFVAKGNDWGNAYMDCKISWLERQKTFAVSYTCYATKQKQFDVNSTAGVVVSESGTIKGPWVWHDWAPHSAHYIEQEDGTTLVGGGMADIHVMKPGYWDAHGKEGMKERWSAFRNAAFRAMPSDTFGYYIEDSWGHLMRMGDKWVCFRVDQPWRHVVQPFDVRSYSSAFCTADAIEGPWSKWQPAVRYGGHAGICKGLDGHYYGLIWAHATVGTLSSLNMVRLVVKDDNGEISIDIDEQWTPDDYKPVAGTTKGPAAPSSTSTRPNEMKTP